MANTPPKHSNNSAKTDGSSPDGSCASDFGTVSPDGGAGAWCRLSTPATPRRPRTSLGPEPRRASVRHGAEESKGRKIALIVLAVIIGLLLAAYLAGVAVFSSLFYPHTKMVGQDLSMDVGSTGGTIVAAAVGRLLIQVEGEGVDFTLYGTPNRHRPEAVGAIARQMHDTFSPWAWPVEIFGGHDLSHNLVYTLGMPIRWRPP